MKTEAIISTVETTNSMFTDVLTHISQGLLFINLESIVTICNPSAEKIFNISASSILFQPFFVHFRDDFFGFSLREALQEQKAPKKTFIVFEKEPGDERELEIDTTLVIRSDVDGPFLQGVIILIRDITELHHLQMAVSRNDRMKALGEMAAILAHEIRNPLGGIKGFASLLQRDLKEQPQLQQLATHIVEGTDTLNRLVTNVLNYVRPLHICFESHDLVKLLQEVSTHVQADSLANKVPIDIRPEHPSMMAPVDVPLFKSAMLNLIVNAIQAMPNGGAITIAIREKSGQAVIQISDQGIGISEQNLKKLFTPFFTTKVSGNGFGLAEVDRVIRAHAGSIEVKSVVNEGTTFTIKIPLRAYVD